VLALEQWLHFAKIDFGPIFVRTSRDGKPALDARLNDKHVARLIKKTVLDAGIRSDLPEAERLALFSGHSLRAGLASGAVVGRLRTARPTAHRAATLVGPDPGSAPVGARPLGCEQRQGDGRDLGRIHQEPDAAIA